MRCCFAKNFEEIIPTLANNIMAKGISKIKPNGNKKGNDKVKNIVLAKTQVEVLQC